MERTYCDTSVILALLLRQSGTQDWSGMENLTTSELTDLECRRALDRIRITDHLSDEEASRRIEELTCLLKTFDIIELDSSIVNRAKGSYPTVVRSLDALHLATAELAQCSLFITGDTRQAVAATAIGLETL